MLSAQRPDWAFRFALDPAMALGLLTDPAPDDNSRALQSNMRNIILSAASFIMRDSDPVLSARLSLEADMELRRA